MLLATALFAASPGADAQARATVSCAEATMTKPNVGVAYRGDVSIDDYKFHTRIPGGLTGWSGTATDAPFHGFTIFLDPSMHSCILFEIHLRIDDDEAPVRPHGAKAIAVGRATAWQITSGRQAKGPVNVTTYFSFRQDGQTDDGKVLLISPPEELQTTRVLYDALLRSVSIGVSHSR
jgi:hypothetical protein